MADANLIKKQDLKYPITVDVTNTFQENVSKMLELLGVTRRISLTNGSTIRIYDKYDVTLADGNVAEGETIPLSKVTRKEKTTKEITLKKYRKATTAEAVQMYGSNEAVTNTDDALVQKLQKEIRKDFVTLLKTGSTTQKALGNGLQGAVASAWGKLQALFEDFGSQRCIIFANPLDIAKYLGNANITTQTAFGMTFINAFTDTTIISTTDIAEGEIWATVPENIVLAYINATNSEMAREFGLNGVGLGYIGMTHFLDHTSATTQTLLMSGMLMYVERLDGIVKVKITEPAPETVGA